ncbi:MAG: 16S rRNA (cytidine(1402)-2'-O)-methyltransferase [Pseudomonadota bacterium]
MSKGLLYVVATPIGNLDDVTIRAIKVLQNVDLIAAEDTRHTRQLLRIHGIETPMLALHEHNERERSAQLLNRMAAGESMALVSDAGTPLISDPGFPLVRQAVRQGIRVVPIPGPSALICALSASGLPTDRFLFVGFPPRHAAQRMSWLRELSQETATLVFYESSHRIVPALSTMAEVFGVEREAVVARELTKLYETFLHGGLGQLLEKVVEDPDQQLGEFVILIHGFTDQAEDEIFVGAEKILEVLSAELPVKQASALTSKITGQKKNELYQRILGKKRNKM